MSRREDIDNAIWSDPDFEDLSLDATVLYLWSFTNPRCGMAGLYKVSQRTMTESKVPLDRIESTLAELADRNFAFYQDGVLFVRTRVRHLRTKTVQIAKSMLADLEKIADEHPLAGMWWAENGELPWLRRLESEGHVNLTRTSSEVHANPDSIREPVTLTRPSPEGHPTLKGNGQGREGKGGAGGNHDPAKPPADFPDTLKPHLSGVVDVLKRIAGARQANDVTTVAVARAMASYPRRPHMKAAEDLEHWLVYGTGRGTKVRDVVGFYRNQLDRRWDDIAAGADPSTGVLGGAELAARVNAAVRGRS